MPERVDVVVVSWNVRDELRRCLASVMASSGVEVHAVVVDNASADGSADMVAAEFPTVRLLRNQENAGFARAANQGIRAGDAPWVLLLNPDTEVGADAVAGLVERLTRLPGHAAVAPRLVHEDGTPQHSAYQFPSLRLALLVGSGAWRLLPRAARARRLLEGAWRSDVERDVPWVIGAALLTRRETLDSIGLLDERFFIYAEDLEWCDRAARHGLRVRFTPAVEVVHHANRSGAQAFGERRTATHLASSLVFLRARHGALWTAAFVALNLALTSANYALLRAFAGPRPSGAARERLAALRSLAGFYLRRA